MAARAGALSAAERSYPTSKVRGSSLECQAVTAQERPRGATLCSRSGAAAKRIYSATEVSGGREELPRVRCQGQRPGGDTPRPKSGAAAERSYPTSEVSGSREETPRVRGSGQPGEATSRPRPRAAAGRRHLCPRPGAVTLRSHPKLKARGGSWEEHPKEERWLRRCRRA